MHFEAFMTRPRQFIWRKTVLVGVHYPVSSFLRPLEYSVSGLLSNKLHHVTEQGTVYSLVAGTKDIVKAQSNDRSWIPEAAVCGLSSIYLVLISRFSMRLKFKWVSLFKKFSIQEILYNIYIHKLIQQNWRLFNYSEQLTLWKNPVAVSWHLLDITVSQV